jgi:hypothetical protein
MAVPYTFGTATSSIPLSQLDSNFNTVITLGNTAIQLGNTVTTLNNMTLANVTISSGNVTITNVAITTANVTTANITTAVIGTATITTSTTTTANVTTANITTDNITNGTVITSLTLSYGTANGVAYLNGSKVLTTGSAFVFDGTNVGIGTTSPGTKLDVNGGNVQVRSGGSVIADTFVNYGTSLTLNSAGSLPMIFQLNGTQAMRLENSNLGLGVTPSAWNASWKAFQFGSVGAAFSNTGNAIWSGNEYLNAGGTPTYITTQYALRYRQDVSSGYHAWFNAPSGTAGNAITFTQAMTLDASGNLLVGTTSSSFGGRVIGSNDGTATQPSFSCINTFGSGTMRQIDFFTGTNTSRIGSIESTTTLTSYNVTSDYRLKEDIAPMTGALAKIAQLKPVTYKWKINGSDGQGFIAHELAEVVPDCVSGEKDAVDANGNPDYQGIDVSFLVATLTAAIQEQQALITSLTARITALESKG